MCHSIVVKISTARESIRRLVAADNEESYVTSKQELYDNTNSKIWDVSENWVKFLCDDHLYFCLRLPDVQ